MTLTAKLKNADERVTHIEHRGVSMLYYMNLNALSYVGFDSPKNGAAWVDFHRAAKELGIIRIWADRNKTWERA